MRKIGWYADRWDELAMNVGTWLAFFGIGYVFGIARTDIQFGLAVGGFGLALGIAGQISWALKDNDPDQSGWE